MQKLLTAAVTSLCLGCSTGHLDLTSRSPSAKNIPGSTGSDPDSNVSPTPVTFGEWRPINAAGAPPALASPTAYVTGNSIIVWGYDSVAAAFAGAVYDMNEDAWTAMAASPVQPASAAARTVWTGTQMLAIGASSGAIFDPTTNVWTAMQSKGEPQYGTGAFVAAYGRGQVIVWGTSIDGKGNSSAGGGVYDLASASWKAMTPTEGPTVEAKSEAVWTGSELLVWSSDEEGGREFYYPDTDAWMGLDSLTVSWPFAEAHLVATDSGVYVLPIDSSDRTMLRFDQSGQWSPVGDMPNTAGTVAWATGRVLSLDAPLDTRDTSSDLAQFEEGGFFYDPAAGKFEVTPTDSGAPPGRDRPAVTMVGDRLFIWGGCAREYSGTCAAYAGDGKTVTISF